VEVGGGLARRDSAWRAVAALDRCEEGERGERGGGLGGPARGIGPDGQWASERKKEIEIKF
jgi:hypothetical protein